MPAPHETPAPEHVALLETLQDAYRAKQAVTNRYRALLARAIATGVSTAVIARYVGVTPQAISTARIRLRPSGDFASPDTETIAETIERLRRIQTFEQTRPKETGAEDE